MLPAKRKRKLKNLTVEYISFVDRAANKEKFYLTKSDVRTEPNFEFKVQLVCSDKPEEQAERLVYGLVYAPDTIDAHGDYTDAETLRKAANTFMLDYNKMDEQHNLVEGAGKIAQSAIAQSDFVINKTLVKTGTWYIVAKANEVVWEKVQNGTYTGFSLYGTAEVEFERTPFEKLLDVAKDLLNMSEKVNTSKEEVMDEKELKELLVKSKQMIADYEEFKKNADEVFTLVKEVAPIIKQVPETVIAVKQLFEEIKPTLAKSESTQEITASLDEIKKSIEGVVEALGNQSTFEIDTAKKAEGSVPKPFPNRTL